jgi:hypothetical protein
VSVFALVLVAAALWGTVACSPAQSTPMNTSEAVAVRAYADDETVTTLQGLSEDNLAKYVQYGNAEFKAALTQAVLDKSSSQITSQFGTFESISFLSAGYQGGYIIVHYRATFSKGKAGIRMVFDTDHLVAGQWFE